MMNLETLQAAVLIWANEKGILSRENADKQLLKFDEESGELSGSILKGNHDLIVDSVGDTLVTLIILAADLGFNISLIEIDKLVKESETTFTKPIDTIGRAKELLRLKGLLSLEYSAEVLGACLEATFKLSYSLSLDPAQCLKVAYNVISKRKTKTINGVVVKEEDLPCEQ